MPLPTLLAAFRAHLISVDLARDPRTAGTERPLFLEPRDGAPAPGEKTGVENDTDLILSAFYAGGIGSPPYESFMRKDTVDLWLRSKLAPTATKLEEKITAAVIDQRAWTMGGLEIIESSTWRPIQRLGSDQQGYVYVVSYLFQRYSTPFPD